MITLDPVVEILAINVREGSEMRVIAVVYCAAHFAISGRFICADRHWPMQPDPLNRPVQKGFFSLCITSGR